jgi:ribosomal protein S20
MKNNSKKLVKSIGLSSLLLVLTTASFSSFAQTSITQSPYGTSLTFGGLPYPSIYQQPSQEQTQLKQAQQQNQDDQKKIDDLSKQLKDAQNKTDTASAQGYVDPNAALRKAAQERDQELDNTPRQKGQVINPPSFGRTVSNDKGLIIWFQNWSYVLNQHGISQQRINFEANRLSEPEFRDWANRQVLASTGQYTPQQEFVNDPQPHDGDVVPTYKQ